MNLDITIFYAIFGLSGCTAWLDWLIVFVGEYSFYLLMLFVSYLVCKEWLAEGRSVKFYGYLVAILGAIIARLCITEIIRMFYQRIRPYAELHLTHLLTDTSYSFPSGHTIFLFALATGVYQVNKKLAYFLYAYGALVGLARIAGGVHYPSDILGGAVLGICTGYLVFQTYKALSR